MTVVGRAVLCFSLLVAFTTSAAAALCLQMEHHDPALMAGAMVTMDSPEPLTGADHMNGTPDSEGSASGRACCHQQVSTPQAITTGQRVSPPIEQAATSSGRIGQIFTETGDPPPGLFDPVLEKRGHLAPSLIKLSISRT